MSMVPLRETGTLPGGMRGNVPMPWIATKDIGVTLLSGIEIAATPEFLPTNLPTATGSYSPFRQLGSPAKM